MHAGMRRIPNYNGEQIIAAAKRGDKTAYREAIIEHEKRHLLDFTYKMDEFYKKVEQYEKQHAEYLKCFADWADNRKRYFDIILFNKYREISRWTQDLRR